MEWNWIINIENNYLLKNHEWDYWVYNFYAKGWEVKDHQVPQGQAYYSRGLRPDQKEVKLFANTKSTAGHPKTLEIYIGCFHYFSGVKKSGQVTFKIESDGPFSNWYYYCNGEYMADSFYDTRSFEVFLTLKEDGELEIVSKENTK